MNNYIWPESFQKGVIDYQNTTEGKLLAVADGLSAWGITTMCGPIEQFGKVMAAIGKFLDIIPTSENLTAESEKLLSIYRDEQEVEADKERDRKRPGGPHYYPKGVYDEKRNTGNYG